MNKLKFYRLQKELTVNQVAKAINISPAGYSKIENGESTVSEVTADKLANLFNIPKEQLFYPVRFTIRDYKEVNFVE